MKVSIIGVGRVGAATAFSLLHSTDIDELFLFDVKKELAQGEALDLQQAGVGLLTDCIVSSSSDYRNAEGSEVIVLAAGTARSPGAPRDELFDENKGIISSVLGKIDFVGNEKILVLSNPIDKLTLEAFNETGLPRQQVMGVGCLLDTFRLRALLGDFESESFVFGQHGELASFALRGTDEVSSNAFFAQGERVLKLKEYSSWAPAVATARTVEAILEDTHEVMPVSCVLDGEFGLRDVAVTVPAAIGSAGVLSVQTSLLSESEQERVRFVAETIYGEHPLG